MTSMPNNPTLSDILYAAREHLDRRAMLEQLAEEAAELSQAALKLIRAEGNGNPTPISRYEAQEKLIEEYADVRLCCDLLRVEERDSIILEKAQRWIRRLEAER